MFPMLVPGDHSWLLLSCHHAFTTVKYLENAFIPQIFCNIRVPYIFRKNLNCNMICCSETNFFLCTGRYTDHAVLNLAIYSVFILKNIFITFAVQKFYGEIYPSCQNNTSCQNNKQFVIDEQSGMNAMHSWMILGRLLRKMITTSGVHSVANQASSFVDSKFYGA